MKEKKTRQWTFTFKRKLAVKNIIMVTRLEFLNCILKCNFQSLHTKWTNNLDDILFYIKITFYRCIHALIQVDVVLTFGIVVEWLIFILNCKSRKLKKLESKSNFLGTNRTNNYMEVTLVNFKIKEREQRKNYVIWNLMF